MAFWSNIGAAATAGGIYAAFKMWRPTLPWQTEVRRARRLAKQKRKIYSFGRARRRFAGEHGHTDTGR